MMDNARTSRKIESSAAAAVRVVLIYAVFAALWIFTSDTALEALVRDPADWARVGMFKGLLFVAATALLLYGLLIRLLKTTGEAQQALAAHYAKLIEQARDIVLLIDPAGRIVEANRAAEVAYGYPHAELLGMTVDDLRAPDSLADVERQWAVADSTEGVLFETRHRHRDGRVFPVEVSSRAIEIQGKLYRQSFIRDISERKESQLEAGRAAQAAQDSKQLLDFALDAASIGYWSLDLITNQAHRSLRHDQCFGYTEAVPVWSYETFLAHVQPMDRDQVDASLKKAMTGLGKYDAEFRTTWPDGSVHWLWATGRLYFDDMGSPCRVAGIVSDITERKLAEMALRSSQVRLIDAQAVTKTGSWETDLSSLRVVWSAQTYTIFGVDPSTFQASHPAFLDFVHPQDREIVDAAFRKSFESTATNTIEHRIVTTTGITKWVEERWRIERDDQANPLRAVGTCQDITERKQADLLITQNEQRLELAVGGAGLGLWDWQVPTGELTVNDRWRSMLGLDPAGPTPTIDLWNSLVHVDDLPKLDQLFNDVIMNPTGRDFEIEIRARHQDGHYLWIFDKGHVAERAADGSPLRVVGTHLDISARKSAAEALLHHQTLLASAEKMGRVGGWEIDIQTLQTTWTEGVYDIYELDGTDRLSVDEGINYYAPASQPIVEQAVQRAIAQGEPFDLELDIITATGNRRNVHTVGRHDPVRGKIVGFLQDITERKKSEEDLRESEYRWRFAIEGSGDGLWDWDIPSGVAYYSSRYKEMLGYADADIGTTSDEWSKRIHPEDAPTVFSAMQPYIDGKPGVATVEFRMLRKDGLWQWILGRGMVMERDAQGKPLRMIGTNTDITERKRAEENLQQAATVFSHTREGITITDGNGTILNVNEAFTRITGYSREDAIGQNPKILSSGRQTADFYKEMWGALIDQGHWSGEIWNRRKDGEVYAELLSISAIRDEQGVTQQYVAMFSDITAIKAHQSQLEHMAHFDGLTNLPNRVLLADRLYQAMAQVQRRQQHLVVVYLDLDGFKAINDQYGHETGDQVLIILAKRLKEALREGDSLARIGGDEFVAVLIDLEDTSASLPLIHRLQAAAALPVKLGHLSLQLSASLGVSFYPQAQDIDADQLLRQADQAMYQAKVAGKNRYCMFDAAQDSNVRKQNERLARIRLALERQEFVLYYQPKVNMRSGKVIGAEALIRWQHPEDGLLAPATFLPTIDDHPLAVDVGEWVIDTAMRQMEVWHAVGLDLPVSVNIGARQLLQDDFVERLQRILAKHPQVHPGCIELEVLETSALNDMNQVSKVIEDCAEIGMRFALDDFGTGYSSLTYLKRLRVTQLKIDQSFVRDMLDDPDDMAILQGIIGLAAAFNREVIAEGVETVTHGTALLQLGCELAQGYGIARPMPPDQLPAWVVTWQPDAAWGGTTNDGEASGQTDK